MDKKAALEVLSRFRTAIESQRVRVSKMILFGFYARGTNREESDIDVIVISEDFADKDYWERTEILASAIYQVFEPIEAVGVTPEEWDKGGSGIVEYARSGEIVYG